MSLRFFLGSIRDLFLQFLYDLISQSLADQIGASWIGSKKFHDISVSILGSARCIIFHSKMEQN